MRLHKLIGAIVLISFSGLLLCACSGSTTGGDNVEAETVEITETEGADVYASHDPVGEAVGIYPGRVVWAYDPDAVEWDGDGYWWNPDNFNETVVSAMVEKSLMELTGEDSASGAWEALFNYHNKRFGSQGGYRQGQKISIKVNMNGSGLGDSGTVGETDMSYGNTVLIKSLLTSLVTEAGVAAEDLTVYDVTRLFPDYMVEACTRGELAGVSFVGRDNAKADEAVPIDWSTEFEGETTYLPTCVTGADYLINLANLKGHSYGVTLAGKNLFGSIMNSEEVYVPQQAGLHPFLSEAEMGEYSPLVDLLAHEQIYDKTFLYMLDGLICAPGEGKGITPENSKWSQSPFNGDFTSSIFISQDQVALDSVGADFLVNEPVVTEANPVVAGNEASENYLHEASQYANPPSGTDYATGDSGLKSLGTHEHWNNTEDKAYSRNLSKDEGIELIRIDEF